MKQEKFTNIKELIQKIEKLKKEGQRIYIGCSEGGNIITIPLKVNLNDDTIEISSQEKPPIRFYLDSNFYIHKGEEGKNGIYTSFYQNLEKESVNGIFGIYKTNLVGAEIKNSGIKTRQQQEHLFESDLSKIRSIDSENSQNLKIILNISEKYFRYILDLIKNRGKEIDETLKFLPGKERMEFVKKIQKFYEGKSSVEPIITDLLLVINCLFENIFSSRKSILISDDSDMEIIFKIIYREIIPRYYAEMILSKIRKLRKSDIEQTAYFNKFGGIDTYTQAIIEKSREHMEGCYGHFQGRKEKVLYILSPRTKQLVVYDMILPLIYFIRGSSLFVKLKTDIVFISVEKGVNPMDIIGLLNSLGEEELNNLTQEGLSLLIEQHLNSEKVSEIIGSCHIDRTSNTQN